MIEISCPWPRKPYSLEFAYSFNMDLGFRRKGINRKMLKGRRQACVGGEPGGHSTPGRKSRFVGLIKDTKHFFSCISHSTFLKVESRSWRFEGGRRRGDKKVGEDKL